MLFFSEVLEFDLKMCLCMCYKLEFGSEIPRIYSEEIGLPLVFPGKLSKEKCEKRTYRANRLCFSYEF